MTSKVSRRFVGRLPLMIGALWLAGCASPPQGVPPARYVAGSTPIATWQSHAAALAARDFGAIYDLSSPAVHERFAMVLQNTNDPDLEAELGIRLSDLRELTGRAAFTRLVQAVVEGNPDAFQRLTRAQIAREPIVEGDHCIIQQVFPDGLEDEVRLVRDPERGVWFLDDPFFGE